MLDITIIAAMGINAVIGQNGVIPWRIPSELAHFREQTVGNICIMGRKTYESLKGPLQKRANIVMSRDPSFLSRPLSSDVSGKSEPDKFPREVFPASDVSSALKIAETIATVRPGMKLVVIGGAEIYRQFMGLANKIILTVVHSTPEGDARFPCYWSREWTIISCETYTPRENDEYGYSILQMERGFGRGCS